MKEPKQYFALWRNKKGKWKQFDTNCKDTAFIMSVRREGTCHIDNRYAAKLRLYKYIVRKTFNKAW